MTIILSLVFNAIAIYGYRNNVFNKTLQSGIYNQKLFLVWFYPMCVNIKSITRYNRQEIRELNKNHTMDLNIHPEISTTVVNKPSKGLLNILDYQHMVLRLQEKKYPKESTRLFFSKEEQAIFEASLEMSAGYLLKILCL